MKSISLSIAAICIFAATTSHAAPASINSTSNASLKMVTSGGAWVTMDTSAAHLGPSGTSRNPWGA